MKKLSIVTTTINVPNFLVNILDNAKKHKEDIFSIYVISDLKTPIEARNFCKHLEKKYDCKIYYLDVEEQRLALEAYEGLYELFPFNDGSRKMIGTVLAYIEGCDSLVMIDDDNFATNHDFVRHHKLVGETSNLVHVNSSEGWFNVCKTMIEKSSVPFYPRGFPWSKRFKKLNFEYENNTSKVVVNQGFVLGDPDIDAVSRLFWPIEVIAFDSRFEPNFALNPKTWAPFNDQNTAISREVIPIYFKPPSTGRNADIWTSYVVAKVAEHFNDVITYGQPLVKQIRNIHDLREDYKIEELHNKATENFLQILKSIKLTKSNYIDTLLELIEKSLKQVEKNSVDNFNFEQEGRHHQLPNLEKLKKNKKEEIDMIKNFFNEYKRWANIMSKITYELDK